MVVQDLFDLRSFSGRGLTEGLGDGDVGEHHDDGHHDDGGAQLLHHLREADGGVPALQAEGRQRQRRQPRRHVPWTTSAVSRLDRPLLIDRY